MTPLRPPAIKLYKNPLCHYSEYRLQLFSFVAWKTALVTRSPCVPAFNVIPNSRLERVFAEASPAPSRCQWQSEESGPRWREADVAALAGSESRRRLQTVFGV